MSSHVSPVDAGDQSHPRGALREAPVRIAAISLAVTACLLALKLVLGIISESIAVLSDAVDSATDLAGGTAALVSVRISRQPADEEHPFGHGKVESLSAAVAATIIALGGGLVTFGAVRRLIEGSPEIDAGLGLIPMVIAAVANIVMAAFMRREARRSGSMALKAESTHLQTNVVQAVAIIIGLTLVWATDEEVFDPVLALLLATYMGWTAIGLVRTASSEIMDTSLPESELALIHGILSQHAHEIRSYHNLRTRRAGHTRQIDMHLVFEAQRTVHDVHETADHVADEIRRVLPESVVVIHVEPDSVSADAG